MKIGFIGLGEAAYCMSAGLRQEKAPCDIYAYDNMANNGELGQIINSRAKEAEVKLLGTAKELVSSVDLVISAVPSNYSLEVTKSVVSDLKPGKVYADVSASTPAAKKKAWDILKNTGVLFADAAMLGSLPQDKHKVPITVSGNGAQAFFDALSPLGMKITIAGERAGDASAIKLIRSIFMKGMASLMIETAQAAMRCDVTEQVAASIGKSMDGISFEEHLTRMIVGTTIHAKRRGAEMKGSVEMCQEVGLPHNITDGTIAWHERVEKYNLAAKYSTDRPKSWREVILDFDSMK